ncbi:MAG TPA: TlpA disulfide reductase family protein [Candidatus Eremiobacteraceae bacterium]|nr:TlpA disulfide reductase family protein [Candidatus Eremiobacteraceae bacterium]
MYRWLVGGLIVVAVVVLTAMFVPSDFDQARHAFAGPAEQVVGTKVPDAVVPDIDGGAISLDAYRGRPVLLNLWATWCGPCRREMPALERLSRADAGKISVVSIDQREAPGIVRAYVRRFGVTFPVGIDDGQQLGTALHLIGLPSSFFVDRDGVIREAVDGEMTFDEMTAKTEQLVAADARNT